MRVVIWQHLIADLLESAFRSTTTNRDIDVLRVDPNEALGLLLNDQVDVALVPSFDILRNADAVGIYPTIALSSWRYPFATLMSTSTVGAPMDQIFAPDTDPQAAFLARIVMAEHYGQKVAVTMPDKGELSESTPGRAWLVTGTQGTPDEVKDETVTVYDLGQEWYELANYPMVWGLFAGQRDRITPAWVRYLEDVRSEAKRAAEDADMLKSLSDVARTFLQQDVRVTLDDLAIASLTELAQYMFYYKLTDELIQPPIAFVTDDDTIEFLGQERS